MTDFTQTFAKTDCHTGNTKIYTEPNGGTLYIGGWNNKAYFNSNTHVIDLTGNEHKYWDIPIAYDDTSKVFLPFVMKAYAGWLSLPFPDYEVPKGLNTREQWIGITETIRDILKTGTDVLVACLGGHGRSGLFCAIVGYMLNIAHDRSWSSPVEKLRKIHCSFTVETISQEKFVYDILGLRIKITHSYIIEDTYGAWDSRYTFEKCPICGTSSINVADFGLCISCQKKYAELAPVRDDLTLEDIKNKGAVDHACTHAKCMGIWTAAACGHTIHDKIVYEGYCEKCAEKRESDIAYAEKYAEKYDIEKCCMCDKHSGYTTKFGVCYDCAESLKDGSEVDEVHNTITDPYRAVPHHCDDVFCVGVVVADTCKHVVHNREVEDGLCPKCLDAKNGVDK